MEIKDLEKKAFRQLISNPSVLVRYISKVAPEDFSTPIIKTVLSAFAGNPSAVVHYVPSREFFEILMRDRFHSPTELSQVAGVLAGLASTSVDTKDLDMLIREIKANRMCREMAQILQKSLPAIKPDTVEQAYESILRDLLQLPLSTLTGINVAKLREIHEALDERVLEYLNPAIAKMPTGIKAFDAAMGGFAAGEFILLSAGSGQGKSYLELWLAEQMVEMGNNTLYVTIEMSYEQTMNRYNSIQTGFDSLDIGDKRIPISQQSTYFEKLIAANKDKSVREAFLKECATIKDRTTPHGALALAKKYKNRPAKMFIMDLPSGCTSARVEQEIQRLSMDNRIDCVFVDFINVMDPIFHNKDRVRELATIAQELKRVARKCKIRLFSAAQLDTTKMEGTQNEVITTDHVKYSKAIGEAADWMMAFHRTVEDNLKKQIRIQMSKTRGSAAVTALLEFDFTTSQAIDLGFADDSPLPHGYLKNGMKTIDFISHEEEPDDVPPPVKELIQENLINASVTPDAPKVIEVPVSKDDAKPLPPLPPLGTDERDEEVKRRIKALSEKFHAVSVKEIKEDDGITEEGWL